MKTDKATIPAHKDGWRNTFHRDGTVSFFDGSWRRCRADHIATDVIMRMVGGDAARTERLAMRQRRQGAD